MSELGGSVTTLTTRLVDRMAPIGEKSISERYKELATYRNDRFRPYHTCTMKLLRKNSSGSAYRLVSDVLSACLQERLVYESINCPVVTYEVRKDRDSTSRQALGTLAEERHVRIYHRGNVAYIAVNKAAGICANEGAPDMNESYFQFHSITIHDFLFMVRPNSSEILEGRVNHMVMETANDWARYLASWTRIDNTGSNVEVKSLRTRNLILSTLGYICGYNCRLEIFEERYGEVLFLVFGMSDKGALRFACDSTVMNAVMSVCDLHEEREKLETVDAAAIAGIYSGIVTFST